MKIIELLGAASLCLITSCVSAQQGVDSQTTSNTNLVMASGNTDAGAENKTPSRQHILKLAKACADKPPSKGLGVHGSALVYEKSVIESPADFRAKGEQGSFANLGDNFRLISIPESPPKDQRTPNGIIIILNLDSGECSFPKMR